MVRYYVKQGPRNHIEGPYTITELQLRLASGALVRASDAVVARGQSLFELRAPEIWRPLAEVVGVALNDPPPELPVAAEGSPASADASRVLFLWWLFGMSLFLLFFAGPVAAVLAPIFGYGGTINGVRSWDAGVQWHLEMALFVLGVLLFLAGLVERVLLTLTPRKSTNGDSGAQ